MKKQWLIYLGITLLFIVILVTVFRYTDLSDNVAISKSVEFLIILFLIRVSYGCTIYIREQYQKRKYSYSIIMNLGLLIFINIHILRHINLLISNWNQLNINTIYQNTIESFSYFAMLTLPCIIILSIYSIITNIVLIRKEGFSPRNLLGIILGFLAIIGLLGSQTIYRYTARAFLGKDIYILKKHFDIVINVTLSYLYTLILATLYCNIRAAKHIPKYDKDYIIILGSRIKEDGTLTPLLKGRADKALEFGKKQLEESKKTITYIPSGGQGNDEIISEAKAIKDYLLAQGIDKKYILVEDQSTSTIENMKFSKQMIDQSKKGAKVCFSTTNYHVFRSGVIASNCGLDCEGMGSTTKWYFYTNALIREFIANLVQEKKKHLGLIAIIYISLSILVWIGYYYHLFEI